MKNASQINTNQQTDFSTTSVIVLFVLLLLSSMGMFGQNAHLATAPTATFQITVASNNDNTVTTAVASNTSETNTNMNMVSWFMGSKQTPKSDAQSDAGNNKRQMINSGIAPNRLLMKAFLKKANAFQSTVA